MTVVLQLRTLLASFLSAAAVLAAVAGFQQSSDVGYQDTPVSSSLSAAAPINSLDDMVGSSDLRASDGHRITWGRANTKDAYFDDMTPTNVTAVVGQTARLPCRVINLGQKDMVRNRKTKEWILQISPVTFRDAGVYECQVSTSPKISLPVTLNVEVQQARIQGPAEVYIQNGSTISLTCVVNTHSENVGAVTWYRNSNSLDYDSPRGGVSLEIEKTPTRTTSKLFITRAIKADSGNYTCAPEFADAAFVMVHVVNGEESAAVQTGGAVCVQKDVRLSTAVMSLLLLAAAVTR
uniref:Muscle, skeletal receptor tyrosine protein kinase-like isoform X1 n=1 Tax=Hirondellea gigas TaxID=1518452 RepID=A0A6A7FVK7_9CRUS